MDVYSKIFSEANALGSFPAASFLVFTTYFLSQRISKLEENYTHSLFSMTGVMMR